MRIHFIAIGGSIMHALAIALAEAGHEVSGSDDHLYDPARSRLEAADLLPAATGWNADNITEEVDAVILGMHAFKDNPELLRAQELNIPIYSFPEFMFQQARQKHRVVVTGSYGKSTITAMIMHVLKGVGLGFDYLVGAQVPGFDNAVKLSKEAQVIIIEGDEYLASRLDPRPKFLLYQPHMVVISGISWDHVNVFPTEESYEEAFLHLVHNLDKAADIIYNANDRQLTKVVEGFSNETHYLHEYNTPTYKVRDGKWTLKLEGESGAVSVQGKHNMENICAAWNVCKLLGLQVEEFLTHIASFEGAHMRMETLLKNEQIHIIRDYAHAPAKAKATVESVRETYKRKKILACLELHTFSSLTKSFLPHYKGSLSKADEKIVYVDSAAVARKRKEPISQAEILNAFGDKNIQVATNAQQLEDLLLKARVNSEVALMMSSGNFGGLDLKTIFN